MGRSGSSAGIRMDRVQQRIERWRSTREKVSPMPAELWSAAVSLAREHGVSMTSRVLGLSYRSLKDRVGSSTRRVGRRSPAAAGFIELDPSSVVSASVPTAAVLELIGSDGAKLVIRLRESGDLDSTALAESFWRRRS